MPIAAAENLFTDLASYLSACKKSCGECIGVVEHTETCQGMTVSTRMHYLKYDGNGQPLLATLAEYLYQHIVHYCIAARNRQEPLSKQDEARLLKDARKYFVHPAPTEDDPDQTGEAGECLLYFLLEAVLGIPQVVAKMELKTNPSDEVKGSDGIHMMWNEADGLVDIYFGEAKLHQEVSGALGSAFKSILAFHTGGMRSHEFKMVAKHFKYSPGPVQEAVYEMFKSGMPNSGVRINHGCLIGYNWKDCGLNAEIKAEARLEDFRQRYLADAKRLHKLLQNRIDGFAMKELNLSVFFLPFDSVQAFRDAFNAALD